MSPIPADGSGADTGRTNGPGAPSDATFVSGGDVLVDRLINRLTTMGIIPESAGTSSVAQGHDDTAQRQSDQGAARNQGQSWSANQWDQPWSARPWSSHSWSGNWDKGDWKEKEERPYISHLEFPKFDGRKESYPNYQYDVLNLKAQCASKDYKYLAPKLIANFTGAMQEDARAMELLGRDFLIDDGVEQLLSFLRKRLHITDLNLETEAFEK